jgi:23S rRNA (adenine2503-C2)-methyltransferase
MIRKLGDDQVKFKLALSLHAATDAKRHEIMPINDTNDIKNYGNYQWLKTSGHPVLWEEQSWRNGCAIFKK